MPGPHYQVPPAAEVFPCGSGWMSVVEAATILGGATEIGYMRPSAVLRANRERVLALAREHGASNVRVFGSILRGTDRDGSDLDLLVDVEHGVTLFALAGLELELGKLLGVAVDVRTPADLSVRIRQKVLAEARPL